MVDEILGEAGAGCNDIGAIVVGTGPGTFTGVRIAVATARALSLALSVPVAGVSTLAALASAVARDAKTNLLVPVVDARRDQVFYGLYRSPGGPEIQRWVRRVPYGVCDRHALAAMLDGPATVVAEDAALVGELPPGAEFIACDVQAERLVYGQRLLTEPGGLPQGARLTPWLIEVLVAGGRPDPEAVKPIYVRAPDADIHITRMKDPWAENASRGPQKEGR